MIAHDTKSFPVLAAAQISGVAYGLALTYAHATRECRDGKAPQAAWDAMVAAHGAVSTAHFAQLVLAGMAAGVIVGNVA